MKQGSFIFAAIIMMAAVLFTAPAAMYAADPESAISAEEDPVFADQPDVFRADQMKPMHYAKLVNSLIKVRISCEPISVRTLAEHQDEFQLVKPDGELFLKPYRIDFLGYGLSSRSEDKIISFFDVIFDYGTKWKEVEDSMNLRIGEDGVIQPLTDGNGTPETCVFQTNDGSWVISIYNDQDADVIAEQVADQFNGGDITLYLDGPHLLSMGQEQGAIAGAFLDHFDFNSLKLFTTFPLNQYEKTGTLAELSAAKAEYVPEAPNLKKVSLILDRFGNKDLPDFEELPSLEEIDLTIAVRYSGDETEVLREIRRPVNISPSLKTIKIYPEMGDEIGNDPDLRIWLAAQAAVCPGLTLNGKPISDYDLEDGMDDSVLSTMRTVNGDAALFSLYQKMADMELSDGEIGEKVIILVLNSSQGFEMLSTDPGSWGEQPGFNPKRLAEKYEDADTLFVIYPVYHEAGTYSGLFTAYSCTTMIAAMDIETEQLIRKETVATSDPPQMTILGSGNTRGSYEINKALDKIAGLVK